MILHLNGRHINWNSPPKATEKVKWDRLCDNGKEVTGSFRTIAHLQRTDNLAVRKFGQHIRVIQPPFNKGVAASAGTHDFDACLDVYIPGVSWWTQQKFFRANGWGAYYRYPPAFGNHIHMFSLPPREGNSISDDYAVHGFKVGEYVDGGLSTAGRVESSSQIEDYYEHRSALSGHASDPSWHPADIAKTIFNLHKFVKRRRK